MEKKLIFLDIPVITCRRYVFNGNIVTIEQIQNDNLHGTLPFTKEEGYIKDYYIEDEERILDDYEFENYITDIYEEPRDIV
jgi:hypothetical protein